jgi:hypothetical protein
VIELMRFRLLGGADENAFLRADARLQTGFAYHQPGLLRRTTARGQGGWIVIDVWRSEEDAEACGRRWDHDPLVAEFMSFVEPSSVATERYQPLAG